MLMESAASFGVIIGNAVVDAKNDKLSKAAVKTVFNCMVYGDHCRTLLLSLNIFPPSTYPIPATTVTELIVDET